MTFKGVIFRAILYFLIAALPEIENGLSDAIHDDFTTGRYFWLMIFCKALISGLVAVRAFFDGAAQRHSDKQNIDNSPKTPQVESKIENDKTPS